jgi:hypothetical protein
MLTRPAALSYLLLVPRPNPPPTLLLSHVNDLNLDALNSQADLDFFSSYNNIYRDIAVNDDPYYGINISSNFHDKQSLSNTCANEKNGMYLSINIQSLMSKHSNLVSEIADFATT